jgi:putative ABC transport system permease protein
MDLGESLRQAVEVLGDHPRRVVASSLGVFWGAAGIVLLLAMGTGFRDYMKDELSRFGKSSVMMVPASTSSGFPGYRKGVRVEIAREDAAIAARESADLIEAILPEHRSRERVLVEAGARVRRLDMTGTDHRYAPYRKFAIGRGRFFDASDVERRNAVAVLGYEAALDLFGSAERALGGRIRVEGRGFEVIGVADPKGRQYMNTHRPDNRLLIVPITAAEDKLGYRKESVSTLMVFPRAGVPPEQSTRAVLASLGPRAGFHPADADALKWFDFGQFLGLVDLFYAGFSVFIGVAGIVTLLIGAVGIANYHLATLSERSVEIAVSKAIGARNRALILQTVLESLLVSGSAALGGVLFGLGTCAALGWLSASQALPHPVISLPAAVVTFLAVLSVAVVAAALPARRVTRIEISEALRAES